MGGKPNGDDVNALALEALKLMRRHEVVPIPRNYALWYSYVSGETPELNGAIDSLITGGEMTDQQMAELHARFLGTEQEVQAIREAGTRMEKALAKVYQAVGQASQGATRYNETLENTAQKLSEGEDADIQSVVASVLDETRSMLTLNRQLESRLESSAREMGELKRDMDALRKEAGTDGLTGLANRRAFDAALEKESGTSAAQGRFLSLLLLDIDHFKAFNDTYGHQMGDQVLKLVAKTLRDNTRAGEDLPARYGGEEFAVILPGCHLAQAAEMADTIRKAVAGKKIVNRRTNKPLGRITMSIGIAEYALGEEPSQMIERADRALYQAKEDGRNQVVSQRDLRAKDDKAQARA